MKHILLIAFCFLVTIPATFAATAMPNKARLSYAIGYTTGKAMKKHGVKVNASRFTQGFTDAVLGTKKPYLSSFEIKTVLKQYRDASIIQKQKALKALADKNLQAGKDYLKKYALQKGVVTTKSGIEYRILKAGIGIKPSLTESVTVDYTASHTNGKIFDQGKSAVFNISNVISGWQKILPMMKVGATWEVVVPSHLAYGSEGAPGILGPNESIIYKIRLIKIN